MRVRLRVLYLRKLEAWDWFSGNEGGDGLVDVPLRPMVNDETAASL